MLIYNKKEFLNCIIIWCLIFYLITRISYFYSIAHCLYILHIHARLFLSAKFFLFNLISVLFLVNYSSLLFILFKYLLSSISYMYVYTLGTENVICCLETFCFFQFRKENFSHNEVDKKLLNCDFSNCKCVMISLKYWEFCSDMFCVFSYCMDNCCNTWYWLTKDVVEEYSLIYHMRMKDDERVKTRANIEDLYCLWKQMIQERGGIFSI